MISTAANRKAILDSLNRRDIKVRLRPHSSDLEYKECGGTLAAWERDAIEICRVGLTRQLRSEAGLCLTCGAERQDKRAELCHECIMARGMTQYHRLMADKRFANKKPAKLRPDQNADFVLTFETEEGESA